MRLETWLSAMERVEAEENMQKALWKTRIHLLSDDERRAMEPFVETKMIESKERIIVDWEPEKARERLSELLFD